MEKWVSDTYKRMTDSVALRELAAKASTRVHI
jgi:hypothetical protein